MTWVIAPTQLENLRRFLEYTERHPMHVDSATLRERLIGLTTPSPAMDAGADIHRALAGQILTRSVVRYTTPDDSVPFGGSEFLVPYAEVREYEVAWTHGEIMYRGFVDLAWPDTGFEVIVDYKTRKGHKEPWWPMLESSWQWRAYCVMAGARRFVLRHYGYAVTDEQGKRWHARWSKGRKVYVLDEPRDLALELEDDWTLPDLGADMLNVAWCLNVSGALRQKRRPGLRALRTIVRMHPEYGPICKTLAEGLAKNRAEVEDDWATAIRRLGKTEDEPLREACETFAGVVESL